MATLQCATPNLLLKNAEFAGIRTAMDLMFPHPGLTAGVAVQADAALLTAAISG